MYGWNQAVTKAESKHTIGGDSPRAVFEIGEYVVEIPVAKIGDDLYAEPPAVTYRSKTRHTTDPRATLPNMEVRDGQIRIEINDLVGLVLSRLEPRELAQALWQDQGVRDEFMDCLVTRYNESGIGDQERRKFLHGVKEAVHDKRIETLASSFGSMEHELSKRVYFWTEIERANALLKFHDIKDDKGEPVRLTDGENNAQFKIGGTNWNEARDYWRTSLAERFPGPGPLPVETPAQDALS